MNRFEVLDFVFACESLLSFVRSQGGAAGLTPDERRTIKMYEKMLYTLMPYPDEAHEEGEHGEAAQ